MSVISSDPTLQQDAQDAAQEECESALVQKYDTSAEFTDTLVYDPTVTYNAADRVYLDAAPYAQIAYAIGAIALQAGKVYMCTAVIAAGEPFNAAHWSLLGNQYDIFFAKFPYPQFNLGFVYAKNAQVFWNGHIYTCKVATSPYTQDVLLQFGTTMNIPPNNIFPDDQTQGSSYWLDGGPYTVSAGQLLNTAYFTAGDNRSKMLVQKMVDITLFHLHSRIAPRNIPEVRQKRYDEALEWLDQVAKGRRTAINLPKIQPPQGQRFRGGSNIKQSNIY